MVLGAHRPRPMSESVSIDARSNRPPTPGPALGSLRVVPRAAHPCGLAHRQAAAEDERRWSSLSAFSPHLSIGSKPRHRTRVLPCRRWPLVIEEVPEPNFAADEVLIRVGAAGMCRTDSSSSTAIFDPSTT
jgi:hypothetical protein